MLRTRLTGTVLIIAFFSLTLCGAGLFSLHAEHGAHVAGCPFAGSIDASCPLSATNSLATFTTVLSSLAGSPILLSLLVALFALIAVTTTTTTRYPPHRVSTPEPLYDSVVWRPLQLAFARGILNPKIY